MNGVSSSLIELNYICPRCGYSTNERYLYVRHLKRKKICKPHKSNVSLQEEYEKYVNCKKELKKDMINRFRCDYCSKIMSTNQSLQRHRKICKIKTNLPFETDNKEDKNTTTNDKEMLLNIVSELNKQLKIEKSNHTSNMKEMQNILCEQLKKQNEHIELLSKKAGISNVNKGIIINGDVKVVRYKDTDNNVLSDKEILSCMVKNNFCIPALIEKIHFNKEYPHNHNIYISNFKNGYVMVYDGHQWNLTNEKDVLDDMIDCKHFFLEQKISEWIEENKYSKEIDSFNKYLNSVEDDKKLNKIKEEVKLLLYNKKDILVSHNKQQQLEM